MKKTILALVALFGGFTAFAHHQIPQGWTTDSTSSSGDTIFGRTNDTGGAIRLQLFTFKIGKRVDTVKILEVDSSETVVDSIRRYHYFRNGKPFSDTAKCKWRWEFISRRIVQKEKGKDVPPQREDPCRDTLEWKKHHQVVREMDFDREILADSQLLKENVRANIAALFFKMDTAISRVQITGDYYKISSLGCISREEEISIKNIFMENSIEKHTMD